MNNKEANSWTKLNEEKKTYEKEIEKRKKRNKEKESASVFELELVIFFIFFLKSFDYTILVICR